MISKVNTFFDRTTSKEWRLVTVGKDVEGAQHELESLDTGERVILNSYEIERRFVCEDFLNQKILSNYYSVHSQVFLDSKQKFKLRQSHNCRP